MERDRNPLAATASPGRAWTWAAWGAVLIVVGGRLELIRTLGTVLPYRDQWKITAEDLLVPWAKGALHWSAFWQPLNDHRIVLTRLWSFLLAWLNGQWNNSLETTLNLVWLVPAVYLLVRTIGPAMGRWLGLAWALLAALLLASPATVENTLWGSQSVFFLQLGLSVAYFRAVTVSRPQSPAWWLGQLAGGLVLLTLRSGVLAPAAALVFIIWQLIRTDGPRGRWWFSLAFALAWVGLYFAVMPAFTVTADMRAETWRTALDLGLRQLAWPLPHPGWAFWTFGPWLALAAFHAPRRRLAGAEAFLLIAGLWVGLQAAAIGYGRGADLFGFASRYCDLLVPGVAINAACLVRLLPALSSHRGRLLGGAGALLWLGVIAPSAWHESVSSHAGYAFEHRRQVNAENLAAVRQVIATGDAAALDTEAVRASLYSYPPAIAAMLAEPSLRALLPPETGAREARPDHGRIGFLGTLLPRAGLGFCALGAVLMVAAARRLPRASAEPVDAGDGASALRFFAIAVLGGGVLAAGAWVAWPAPGKFSRESRLAEVVAPRRAEVHYQTLELHAETAGLELAASAFRSAVATQPADLRPFMAGTLIGGESQTGAFSNQPFIVQERFLSVLYSGWPNIAGNGLRWYLRDPKSEAEEWVSLVQSSNPGNDLACWQIDAALWQGWEASLVLFAGRTDAFGWVGVMPPVSSNDAQFGRTWLAGLRAERAEATHRVLAAAVAGAAILALILGGLARRARRRERAAAAN